jgi:hypothetical protein
MDIRLLLANLLLAIHVAWVALVVLGFVAILVGLALKAPWARSPWIRIGHLLMIATVVLETWLRLPCPLTIWERDLRVAAGQTIVNQQDCIGYWLRRAIFIPVDRAWLHAAYFLFGALVLAAFLLAPPRFRPRKPPAASRPTRLPPA